MTSENLAGASSWARLLGASSKLEEGDEITENNRKGRGQGKIWHIDTKFTNERSAEEFIKNEQTWAVQTVHMTEEGVKRYYRCNKVKCRARVQCSAAIYLLFDAACDEILLYRTEASHDHDNNDCLSRLSRLDEKTKKEIERLFELRLKPKSMMKNLSNTNGIIQPTKPQLNYYLNILRKRKS